MRYMREQIRLAAAYYVALLMAGLVYGLAPALALARSTVGASTVFSDISGDAVTFIAVKTLMVAEQHTRLYQFADKAILPEHNSKTFQYTRYDKLDVPLTTLTEGVTPDSTVMSITTVTATVEQWGMVVTLTDIAMLTIKHPLLQKAIELEGLAMAYVVERELQNVLLAGTNIRYADAAASRNALSTSNTLDTADVAAVTSTLRKNGAPTFEADLYAGVIRPDMEMDLAASDSDFKNASSRSAVELQFRGEIARWYGIRWIRSNTLPVYTLMSTQTGTAVAAGGSLVASTAYDFAVTRKDVKTGIEDQISATVDVSTGASDDAVRFTMPSTTGYVYDVYAGSDGGTLYLFKANNAASAVVDVTSIPTSGSTRPAVPASGVTVAIAFVFGKEAFTCVSLESQAVQGGNTIRSYLTPPGASDSDKLAQRRSVGGKMTFKAVITNANFFRRIEAHTAF